MIEDTITNTLIAFFSTTLDDLLALVYLFLDKKNEESVNNAYLKIIIGQFIGFTFILLIVFFIGSVLGAVIPSKYINLMGFIPLLIGLQKFYESVKERCFLDEDKPDENLTSDTSSDKTDTSQTSNEIIRESNIENDDIENVLIRNDRNIKVIDEQGFEIDSTKDDEPCIISLGSTDSQDTPASPVGQTPTSWIRISGEEPKEEIHEVKPSGSWFENHVISFFKSLIDPIVLESAVLQFVCGSDNISIYTALFATESLPNIAFTILVFYLLLLINAIFAYTIVKVS